ncbi:MAG: hypothetical protein ACFFCW_47820 [Candidatus Hodarchaeota archaeon]
MKTEEIVKYLKRKLNEQGFLMSKTVTPVLFSNKYLNRQLLKTMTDADVRDNIDILVKDLVSTRKARLRKAFVSGKFVVSNKDIRVVLSKRFCSLPPFCK